ncbi:hypothetical protein [Hymenobacter sp. DG01]|uniref:hypothetical protein n=1 Tax=Hymenobacter sp. DG01 TaxID=2584940 RepID=UPI00111CDB86|nr:hypothetical protein [Hymenobacter sp. DG01]
MEGTQMHAQPPHGFIVKNGKYILVRANYVPSDAEAPVPNWEYQRLMAEVICDIGNAIGELPQRKDAFTVNVPYNEAGDLMMLACRVQRRFFRPAQYKDDTVNGRVPDLVAVFVIYDDQP